MIPSFRRQISFPRFPLHREMMQNPGFLPVCAVALLVAARAFAQAPPAVGQSAAKQEVKQQAKQVSPSTPASASARPETISVPNDLLTVQEGQIPIILSAPHGGLLPIPGAEPRKGEGLQPGPSGYQTVRDVNTDRLALALSAAIEAKMGQKPYLVVAKFARKYADVNRPSTIGYESPAAKPVYEAYHQTLTRFCREVQQKWGRGLVLDIHGQGVSRDTIFRGTGNGKSLSLLVERYGVKARNGPESFAGLLTARGCKIIPMNDSPEHSGFTGGYITLTYGSRNYGMDAIQLEFGGDYTNKDKRKDTATKLAEAIADFARLYLPEKIRDTR